MTSFLLDLVPAGSIVRAALGLVAKPFVAVWRWIMADYHRPVLMTLLFALVMHWLVIDSAVRDARDAALGKLAKTQAALVAEQDAHAATVRSHQQAAAQAKAAQDANLARVAAEQNAQSERIASAYQNDLADLRARRDQLALRLWQATAPDGSGVPGTVYVPGPGEGSGRIAQASNDQGLPAAACTPMNLDERFVASAQALQLDALIDWVEAQSALEMNP